MSYTLIRGCKSCGQTFRYECEPGETWPDTCGTCDGPRQIDNKLGIQAGPLTPPTGDGTGRKRGW